MFDTCVFKLIFFFFFNDTATTEIYTLSLHDALPISQLHFHQREAVQRCQHAPVGARLTALGTPGGHASAPAEIARDRKSTRLNSSHLVISYAVFCLKKKKINIRNSAINFALHTAYLD